MKRRELVKRINKQAKAKGWTVIYEEGKKHTKVTVEARKTTIPRHAEIKEPLARGILDDLDL